MVKVVDLRKMKAFGTYRLFAVNLLLIHFLAISTAFGQPPNNSCSGAVQLCPGISVSGTNEDANATVCPDCEDDFNFCFPAFNTTWYKFTTNDAGGIVTIDFSNLNFVVETNRGNRLQAVIVSASIPCNASTFTVAGSCQIGSAGNFTLTSNVLDPATTYYVIINGEKGVFTNALPAEATFDIVANGPGIVRPDPAIFIGGPGTELCPNQNLYFIASTLNCPDSTNFTWKVNGTTRAITQQNLWYTSTIEDGDVVTVENTCYSSDCPVTITTQYGPMAVENLTVDAGADQMLNSGETTHLNGSTNGISYSWSPAISLSDPTILQPIAYPESTTSYFLTASSDNCTLSDEVIITVTGKFSVPGSFSPNGDGVNDTWIITGIDIYPNANVVLFDRWGQQIADIVGYSNAKSWDGTHKGKAVTDGVYFYQIDLRDENESKPLTGYVTVLR